MKYKNFSIYHKICRLFFTALIPIVMINLVMIQVSNIRIKQQCMEKMELQLASKVTAFDDEMSRINSSLRVHMMDGSESFLASNYSKLSSWQLGQKVSELNDSINELALISGCIEDIVVYMPQIERAISLAHYYEDRITESDLQRVSKYRHEDNGNIYDNGKLRIHMVAPTTDSDQIPLYVLEAVLSDEKILSFIGSGFGGEYYALAGDDWVICGEEAEEMEKAVLQIRQQTDDAGSFVVDGSLFSYRRLSLYDGWMISCTEADTLMETTSIFTVFTVVTLFVTIAAIMVVIFMLSRSVNRPFQQLLGLFQQVESGSLDVKTDYQFQDEFKVVFDQFDRMISRIRELLTQSVEREKELQRAEYKQLQAHIAPHFLYNSFNVLRHCVLMEDYETASEMSRLLGNYFRYITYGDEEETIFLLDEYKHAEDYLEIQKIRFQDNILMEIEPLPETFSHLRVPPFILQPLVENVFKHGIKDMAYTGQISIYVEAKETELQVIVWDNGYGVNAHQLEVLQRAIDGGEAMPEHSGLVNIHKRLKIILGEDAGLSVESEPNTYFKTTIHIPLGGKEVKHDQYTGG